ncbi:CGNR zinc finger domain-containing protein [Gordonia sp. MP11Mi]|uniref:Zinc finger CGNR domain-containing protein n=1 Tax=Gordonia sp. MP11Mi TaxID=3022769 RepID=A0AA97CVJ8_9ACTN
MDDHPLDHYRWWTVDLAVQLINSAPEFGRAELLTEPADVDALLAAQGARTSRFATGHDVQALRSVRSRLAIAATTNREQAAALLNDIAADAGATPRVTCHDGHDWHIDHHIPGDWPWRHIAAESAVGLMGLLLDENRGRLRICAADDCHRLLADRTKNGSTRFCPGLGCANRERVRRYRARRAAGAEAPFSPEL